MRPQKNGAIGIPAEGSVLPNPNGKIPRNRNTNEPNSTSDTNVLRLGYDLEHRFSSNWQIRSAFEFSSFQRYKNYLFNSDLAEDEHGSDAREYFFLRRPEISPEQAFRIVSDRPLEFGIESL